LRLSLCLWRWPPMINFVVFLGLTASFLFESSSLEYKTLETGDASDHFWRNVAFSPDGKSLTAICRDLRKPQRFVVMRWSSADIEAHGSTSSPLKRLTPRAIRELNETCFHVNYSASGEVVVQGVE